MQLAIFVRRRLREQIFGEFQRLRNAAFRHRRIDAGAHVCRRRSQGCAIVVSVASQHPQRRDGFAFSVLYPKLPSEPLFGMPMSTRRLFLLSPYRLPTNQQILLNEDEMAAWLNGTVCLWHPALIWGARNRRKSIRRTITRCLALERYSQCRRRRRCFKRTTGHTG